MTLFWHDGSAKPILALFLDSDLQQRLLALVTIGRKPKILGLYKSRNIHFTIFFLVKLLL